MAGRAPWDAPDAAEEREPLSPGGARETRAPGAASREAGGEERVPGLRRQMKYYFAKILQIFSGLVLGCIKPKFCKKICV